MEYNGIKFHMNLAVEISTPHTLRGFKTQSYSRSMCLTYMEMLLVRVAISNLIQTCVLGHNLI